MIFSPTHSYVFLFNLNVLVEWSSVGQSNMHCCHVFFKKKKHLCETAWAPSVFGAVWFCRWVVTHSLRRFQLLWPRSWCLHHTEHPFAYRKVGADMLWPCLSWERQVESLIARTAYQLWPTTNLWYSQRPSKKWI